MTEPAIKLTICHDVVALRLKTNYQAVVSTVGWTPSMTQLEVGCGTSTSILGGERPEA